MPWVQLKPHRYCQIEQAPSELALTIAQQSLQEPYEAEERVPNEGRWYVWAFLLYAYAQEKAKNHGRECLMKLY